VRVRVRACAHVCVCMYMCVQGQATWASSLKACCVLCVWTEQGRGAAKQSTFGMSINKFRELAFMQLTRRASH